METFPRQAGLDPAAGLEILTHLASEGLLSADSRAYWFTEEGERELGGMNFMDLLSIFVSEDLFEVRCGNKEIGRVDRVTFTLKQSQCPLLLGGRAWTVLDINWKKGVVKVEPSKERGKSRWLGDGPAIPYELCQAMRRIVCMKEDPPRLLKRATEALADARSDLWWFHPEATTVFAEGDGKVKWYTHGETVAIVRLAWRLRQLLDGKTGCDEHSVTMPDGVGAPQALAAIELLRNDPMPFDAEAFRPLAERLKFYETLPSRRVAEMVQARYEVRGEVEKVLREQAVLVGCPLTTTRANAT
jgi:ATP-dependent Lhr-like helicase